MTEIEARTEKLTAALRRAGVRITRQRATLLSVLAEDMDHPGALELMRRAEVRAPGISLSTVYRFLSELEAQGVILWTSSRALRHCSNMARRHITTT